MPHAVLAPIVVNDQGVAYVEGTTTKVIEVVLAQQATGQSAEALCHELPHLTLAQIHAALFYYHANKDTLDAEIQRRFELAEQLRLEAGESPFARRMCAEGRLS